MWLSGSFSDRPHCEGRCDSAPNGPAVPDRVVLADRDQDALRLVDRARREARRVRVDRHADGRVRGLADIRQRDVGDLVAVHDHQRVVRAAADRNTDEVSIGTVRGLLATDLVGDSVTGVPDTDADLFGRDRGCG